MPDTVVADAASVATPSIRNVQSSIINLREDWVGSQALDLLALSLGDDPDLSSLIRAHEESSRVVKGETCRSETILVPHIVTYLTALADIWITHDVDDCSLAVWLSYRETMGKVYLRDFVAC